MYFAFTEVQDDAWYSIKYFLYHSKNLSDLELCFEMESVGESTKILCYNCNDGRQFLLLAHEDTILVSNDMKSYRKISLVYNRDKYKVKEIIEYQYINSKHRFIASVHTHYTYEKNFIVTSITKESGMYCIGIFEGDEFESLTAYMSKDDFSRGDIRGYEIAVSNGNVYGVMTDHDRFDNRTGCSFITFKNGKFVALYTFSDYTEGLYYLNGIMYTKSWFHSDPHICTVTENGYTPNNPPRIRSPFYNIETSEEFGVALSIDYQETCVIYMTDNFNNYRQIPSPIEGDSVGYCVGGEKKIIVWPSRFVSNNDILGKFYYLTLK